jgi:hypothetical protein
MCTPHPPGGPVHYATLNQDSIRACIGTLEISVGAERAGSQAQLKPCFDYLREVSQHFLTHNDGGGCRGS